MWPTTRKYLLWSILYSTDELWWSQLLNIPLCIVAVRSSFNFFFFTLHLCLLAMGARISFVTDKLRAIGGQYFCIYQFLFPRKINKWSLQRVSKRSITLCCCCCYWCLLYYFWQTNLKSPSKLQDQLVPKSGNR